MSWNSNAILGKTTDTLNAFPSMGSARENGEEAGKMRRQNHHKCTNCFYRNTGMSKVTPSLHSDGNHITGNAMFYCFWQH